MTGLIHPLTHKLVRVSDESVSALLSMGYVVEEPEAVEDTAPATPTETDPETKPKPSRSRSRKPKTPSE